MLVWCWRCAANKRAHTLLIHRKACVTPCIPQPSPAEARAGIAEIGVANEQKFQRSAQSTLQVSVVQWRYPHPCKLDDSTRLAMMIL
jgi:hypothetical protein